MGITIIQKSDLSVRKKDAKVALVLAGGALTGGAFKLGGLKALDDFLINRKVTDFDVYVGLSAGALLGAPLAAGVTPTEMLRALDGTSVQFSRFRPGDFYNLNSDELMHGGRSSICSTSSPTYPASLIDLVRGGARDRREIRPALSMFCRRQPSLGDAAGPASPIVQRDASRRFPIRTTTCRRDFSTTSRSSATCGETSKATACRTTFEVCHATPAKICTSPR